jgi:hypothetical protein
MPSVPPAAPLRARRIANHPEQMTSKNTGPKNTGPGARKDHPARNVQPKGHDPYRRDRKHAGAFVCESCGVVEHAGKWAWGAPPLAELSSGLCPACQRIRDNYPAGTLRLRGACLEHLEEIRGLLANQEQAEKQEHPLERLMAIEEGEGEVTVTTTGVHLAKRITSALERRFHAKAEIRRPDEQELMFVEFEA